MGDAAETAATGRKRKRKSEIGESRLSPTKSVNFKARRLSMAMVKDSISPASSGNSTTCEGLGSESDQLLASCCSSNEWSDDLANGSSKFVDLEVCICVRIYDYADENFDYISSRSYDSILIQFSNSNFEFLFRSLSLRRLSSSSQTGKMH